MLQRSSSKGRTWSGLRGKKRVGSAYEKRCIIEQYLDGKREKPEKSLPKEPSRIEREVICMVGKKGGRA
jgi:hypothetical protein